MPQLPRIYRRPAPGLATDVRSLAEVQSQIVSGDLVLVRRAGLISRLGRGHYAHAGMAIWWGRDVFLAEMRLGGGRAVPLAGQVERYPGRFDLYEANADNAWRFNPWGAVAMMRRLIGRRYGLRSTLRAALRYTPVVRVAMRPPTDDELLSSGPPNCSEAVAIATRVGGGIDPIPNLSDSAVVPADLARSPFFRYRFTLIP